MVNRMHPLLQIKPFIHFGRFVCAAKSSAPLKFTAYIFYFCFWNNNDAFVVALTLQCMPCTSCTCTATKHTYTCYKCQPSKIRATFSECVLQQPSHHVKFNQISSAKPFQNLFSPFVCIEYFIVDMCVCVCVCARYVDKICVTFPSCCPSPFHRQWRKESSFFEVFFLIQSCNKINFLESFKANKMPWLHHFFRNAIHLHT